MINFFIFKNGVFIITKLCKTFKDLYKIELYINVK